MANYDYGNARLHAMKSRLLTRQEVEALAELESVQSLVSALIKTAYQPAVEYALARAAGIEVIYQALHYEMVHTVRKTRSFFRNKAAEMVDCVLRSYDIHNLKAILRGLVRHTPPAEILSTLLPVGELPEDVLTELSRASSPREAVDMMASMNLVFAHPLLRLRAERPGVETAEMELALDRWLFQEAGQYKEERASDAEVFVSALEMDADITNLVTTLRFAHTPAERKALRQQTATEKIRHLLVGPGRLPFKLLESVANQEAFEEAIKLLSASPYAVPLQAGLETYRQSGRLSDIERRLQRYRLEWAVNLISEDPLGIGVFLGFLALKINEVGNLRWIAQGIHTGLKPDAIRPALEFVS